MTQQELLASLPAHLRPFVETQAYSDYTPRDHAVWRFVMKHLTTQLATTAHPVFLEGLERTGIALDHIPSIEEMNLCLARLGWRAVVVDGFIPPPIFMEFQALRILVIALDMRSVEHIFYTPAPDILHESAGHAPFLVDIDYAEFLQRFGEVGMKAIATRRDLEQYEAIRHLSILKECPDTQEADIEKAEAALRRVAESDATPSEAALLARLHWWTVEYGLVGDVDNYRIFGAGLLSSLDESRHCLDDERVRKLPLTVDAVATPYNITREQPQLFVTKSCRHLFQVLEEFAASMGFTRGGSRSLQTAIDAGSVCTAMYDTGVQVSGVFCEARSDAVGNAIYLRTSGPTQLAYDDRQLPGHGVDHHASGFGSPIGHLKDFSRCLSEYTIDELKAHDITVGQRTRLEYLSGIVVDGCLAHVERQNHRNLVLSFTECAVTNLDGDILFAPDWGTYDLAVGARIASVYGGVADREKRQLFRPTPRTKTVRASVDERLMAAYEAVRALHLEQGLISMRDLGDELRTVLDDYPLDWLLRVELLATADQSLKEELKTQLRSAADTAPHLRSVVDLALS